MLEQEAVGVEGMSRLLQSRSPRKLVIWAAPMSEQEARGVRPLPLQQAEGMGAMKELS